MTDLKQFTDEERDLLIALPYRAGLLISSCDDAGGHEAEEAELKALENIVTGYTEDFCKSAFMEALMLETVARRNDWEKWRKDTSLVLTECRRAVEILSGRVEPKELADFKHDLMEIATTVAEAHSEMGPVADFSYKLWVYSRYFRGRLSSIIGKKPARSLQELFSVSKAEAHALSQLENALNSATSETRLEKAA